MSFKVFLHPKSASSPSKLDRATRKRIESKPRELETHPERGKRLRYSDFWILRIGDHRAIYEIDEEKNRVVVLFIGHRENVYDDFSKLF
ncbi:MAG: type II toxin-antitoxin system RelE/ParE family toxin [Candidatus Thermoplasmatota archaeon]|nr:type II toxin-antitoxin system RelE/ParE family toxin [Candidatus Thermoplasmatota archaeon]